jgi:hypothetical protein
MATTVTDPKDGHCCEGSHSRDAQQFYKDAIRSRVRLFHLQIVTCAVGYLLDRSCDFAAALATLRAQ